MMIEWPVQRVALVVDNDELDRILGVPKGQSPLEIPGSLSAWDQAWPEYDQLVPCWIHRRVVEEVEQGIIAAPWIKPAKPQYRHIDGRPVRLDPWGRALNPRGRNGRNVATGSYWHDGPNWAADGAPLAWRDGQWWVLMVRRGDNKRWALAGGMCDAGETAAQAAPRELVEETGFRLLPEDQWRCIRSGQVGAGYAYTWVETGLYVCEVHADRMSEPLVPQAGEVDEVQWWRLDRIELEQLNPGHEELVTAIKQDLKSRA